MRKILATTAVAAMLAGVAPAQAQVNPVIDTSQAMGIAAQGVAREQIARDYRPRSVHRGGRATARQAAACAQKTRLSAEHGAGHPTVRRLYGLCRSVGL